MKNTGFRQETIKLECGHTTFRRLSATDELAEVGEKRQCPSCDLEYRRVTGLERQNW